MMIYRHMCIQCTLYTLHSCHRIGQQVKKKEHIANMYFSLLIISVLSLFCVLFVVFADFFFSIFHSAFVTALFIYFLIFRLEFK